MKRSREDPAAAAAAPAVVPAPAPDHRFGSTIVKADLMLETIRDNWVGGAQIVDFIDSINATKFKSIPAADKSALYNCVQGTVTLAGLQAAVKAGVEKAKDRQQKHSNKTGAGSVAVASAGAGAGAGVGAAAAPAAAPAPAPAPTATGASAVAVAVAVAGAVAGADRDNHTQMRIAALEGLVGEQGALLKQQGAQLKQQGGRLAQAELKLQSECDRSKALAALVSKQLQEQLLQQTPHN